MHSIEAWWEGSRRGACLRSETVARPDRGPRTASATSEISHTYKALFMVPRRAQLLFVECDEIYAISKTAAANKTAPRPRRCGARAAEHVQTCITLQAGQDEDGRERRARSIAFARTSLSRLAKPPPSRSSIRRSSARARMHIRPALRVYGSVRSLVRPLSMRPHAQVPRLQAAILHLSPGLAAIIPSMLPRRACTAR